MSFTTPASTSETVTPFATVTGQEVDLGGAEELSVAGVSSWGAFTVQNNLATLAFSPLALATALAAGAVTSLGLAGSDLHKTLLTPAAGWTGGVLK